MFAKVRQQQMNASQGKYGGGNFNSSASSNTSSPDYSQLETFSHILNHQINRNNASDVKPPVPIVVFCTNGAGNVSVVLGKTQQSEAIKQEIKDHRGAANFDRTPVRAEGDNRPAPAVVSCKLHAIGASLSAQVEPLTTPIEKISLHELSLNDQVLLLDALFYAADQGAFSKSNFSTQILTFIQNLEQKYPDIAAVSKLMQLYKGNYRDQIDSNAYFTLTQSMGFVKAYQSLEVKPNIEIANVDNELVVLSEHLSGEKMAGACTTANADAAFKVIEAAQTLQKALKLNLNAKELEISQAAASFKLISIENK